MDVYGILADLLVLLHFIWILFLLVGVVFALMGSRLAWVHLGGLVFSFFLNLFGWYCPLTYLENYLYSMKEAHTAYTSSFLAHYLEKIVYPDLPEKSIRLGEILFVVVNLMVYGLIGIHHRRQSAHDRR